MTPCRNALSCLLCRIKHLNKSMKKKTCDNMSYVASSLIAVSVTNSENNQRADGCIRATGGQPVPEEMKWKKVVEQKRLCSLEWPCTVSRITKLPVQNIMDQGHNWYSHQKSFVIFCEECWTIQLDYWLWTIKSHLLAAWHTQASVCEILPSVGFEWSS